MKNNLAYLINPSSSQTWALNSKQKNIIGRGIPKNDENNLILLPHPSVSKIHASLWLDEQSQEWYFENLSRNGSSINGIEITSKKVIHNGDKIAIGPFELLFCDNLLDNEGTVEVKKNDSLSLGDWSNSPTKLEMIAIGVIFACAILLVLVWIWRMFYMLK